MLGKVVYGGDHNMSFEAIQWVLNQPLKPLQSRLLIELCSHLNGETGQCNPSITRLEKRLLVSRPAITKALKELESVGAITKNHNYNSSTQYKINTNTQLKNLTTKEHIVVKNINQGSKESLPVVVKNINRGSKESLPKTVIKQEVETGKETDKDSSNHSVQELSNKKYTDQFELFWSHAVSEYKKCNSSTGNKSEAFGVWKKLKPTEQDVKNWARIITEQANTRKTTTENGGKIAPFKHVCRWLKYSGWEDIVEGWSTGYRKPEEPRSTLRMM